MSQKDINKIGRINYIEPTNLTSDGNYLISEDKLQFPYEDYNMSVDLTVRIVNRYSCGWSVQNGLQEEFKYSTTHNTISFLGGTKKNDKDDIGYLTTNFTDVSMISPSGNTSECLGIESISISYDGQFLYPLVTIKFIDVKGATLMQPSEAGYYNKADIGNSKHIYRALFTMPYPMFTLKVKGFYGKGATYNLVPIKTNMELNSETGNFNITVTFNGYMFGVYTDIPLTLLAAAPYMERGRLYWDEQVKNGTFKFKDAYGVPSKDMMKLPELRMKIALAAQNEDATSAANKGSEMMVGKDEQISALRNLSDTYPFKKWKTFGDYRFILLDEISLDDINIPNSLAALVSELKNYYDSVKNYDKAYGTKYIDVFSNLKQVFDNKNFKIEKFRHNLVENYNYSPYGGGYTSTWHKLDSDKEDKLRGRYIKYTKPSLGLPYHDKIIEENIDFNSDEFKESMEQSKNVQLHNEIVKNGSDIDKFQKEYLKLCTDNYYYLYFIPSSNEEKEKQFLGSIETSINKILEEKTEIDRQYKAKEMSIIEKVLGFRPSIRNIYELMFAHMDTFMHCFYSSTGKIREQIEGDSDFRKKKYHNVDEEDATDTERLTSDINGERRYNKYLPPFAAFYKDVINTSYNSKTSGTTTENNKRKEFVWPGEISTHSDELEEVNFINDLLQGAQVYNKRANEINETLNNLSSGNSKGDTSMIVGDGVPTTVITDFIPTTQYDYVYKNKISNPYLEVLNFLKENPGSDVSGYIFGIFALRAYYYLAINGKQTEAIQKKAEGFGKLEAINLYKALGDNTNPKFLEFIKKYAHKNDNRGDINVLINGVIKGLTSTGVNVFNKHWNNGGESLFIIDGKNLISYNLGKYENKTRLPILTFNFNQIKSDYNANIDKIDENENYLNTKIPSVNDIVYSKSFEIFEARDYVDAIQTNIKLELTKQNSSNNDIGIRDSGNYMSEDDVEKLLDNEAYMNNIHSLLDDNETFLDGDTVYDMDGNNVSRGICNEIIGSKTTMPQSEYWIKYPTKIDEKEDLSLFGLNGLYEVQDNIEAKAYLFLQALPLRKVGESGNIISANKSGVIPKSLLLREGSYYWYKENSVKVKAGNFKKPNTDEYYCGDSIINAYETMAPIEKNSNNDYPKWDYPKKCTPDRVKVLKDYFVNWANDNINGFAAYENLLVSSRLYTDGDLNKGLSLKVLKTISPVDANKLQEFLRNVFFKVNTVFDLYSHNGLEGKSDLNCNYNDFFHSINGFINGIKSIYGDIIEKAYGQINTMKSIIELGKIKSPFENRDIKLSTYMTLKSLYDKWLCAPQYGPEKTWSLNSGATKSDFNNFIYADSYYHDIGNLFTVNVTSLSNWLNSCLPTLNTETNDSTNVTTVNSKSMYEFLTEVAQGSGAMLLALPQQFGQYGSSRIKEMFKPISIHEDWDLDESSFVFMYTYKPSEHLGDESTSEIDMNGYSSKGDGLILTDNDITGSIFGDDGFTVPAFGVTYAKQNQSFFKNISLSNQNAGMSEVAIASTMNVASKASESPRESILYGQDIYKILTNNSFKCGAEMLGNIQIMPLMYFQLNNVPFWRGAYQILRVNHNISAGKFITNFEGIRINKHSIPLANSSAFIIPEEVFNEDNKTNGSNDTNGNNNGTHNSSKIVSINTNGNNIEPNYTKQLNRNYVSTIDFNEKNITKQKPLICITPAHGPRTKKSLEWQWSSKVVDRIVDILKSYEYFDGTKYNVQRCNKNGNNTRSGGYSMQETYDLILKYGSEQVVSVVPHWNGGGGKRYEIYLNYEGKIRSDSVKLAECMKSEVETVISQVKNVDISISGTTILDNDLGTTKLNDAISNRIDILPLSPKNTDGAPRCNCACILTENWYSDYHGKSKGPDLWALGKHNGLFYQWLIHDKDDGLKNGVETIAQMHAKAIKRYIDSLN